MTRKRNLGPVNEFAGTILLTPDLQFILQLRDDNPAIVDPGKLSLFAGRVEPDEGHATAARRELHEETGLVLGGLAYYRSFQKDNTRHGGHGICHIYVANAIDPLDLHVREGQSYRLASPEQLTETNTALISYDILMQYATDNSL